MLRSVVIGTGSYLPTKVVTNEELSEKIDTTDAWIVSRTGIHERRIAADDQATSDLAYEAASRAVEAAGLTAEDIDLIVLATATPDSTFPATATRVQAKLGAHNAFAFDVQAVCAGFVYALSVADNFLQLGKAKRALVIGAETFSRILDWEDRGTCVLFGDGAGAVVIEAQEGEGSTADRGVLSCHLHSDGRLYDLLYVDGGVSTTQTTGHLRMSGQEVFKHAVTKLSAVLEEGLEATGLSSADIDWFVPHQANRRIIEAMARKLGITGEKVILTVGRHANTSAASIPLALDEGVTDRRIKRGDIVVLEAIGGGLAWGSAVIRW